jgi:hypothetical protein
MSVEESVMAAWRIFVIFLLSGLCLIAGGATIVMPMTETAGKNWWLWFLGMAALTAACGALLALFLRNSSQAMK